MINAILIDPKDNVATVTEPAACGADVLCRCGALSLAVTALSSIPCYHKIAVRFITCGEPVLKYGEVIGYAREDIPAGGYVHTHNVSDSPEEVDAS